MSSPPVATAPPRVPAAEPTAAVRQLRALLRATVRVSVTDGRIFVGTFAGTDKQLNILIVGTDEYRVGPDTPTEGGPRYVGQIMVPWRLVVRIEARRGQGAEPDDGGWPRDTIDESEEESMYT